MQAYGGVFLFSWFPLVQWPASGVGWHAWQTLRQSADNMMQCPQDLGSVTVEGGFHSTIALQQTKQGPSTPPAGEKMAFGQFQLMLPCSRTFSNRCWRWWRRWWWYAPSNDGISWERCTVQMAPCYIQTDQMCYRELCHSPRSIVESHLAPVRALNDSSMRERG